MSKKTDDTTLFIVHVDFPDGFPFKHLFSSLKELTTEIVIYFDERGIFIRETIGELVIEVDIPTTRLGEYFFMSEGTGEYDDVLALAVTPQDMVDGLGSATRNVGCTLTYIKRNRLTIRSKGIEKAIRCEEVVSVNVPQPKKFDIYSNVYKCTVEELKRMISTIMGKVNILSVRSIREQNKNVKEQGIFWGPGDNNNSVEPLKITRSICQGFLLGHPYDDEYFEVIIADNRVKFLNHIDKWADKYSIVNLAGSSDNEGTLKIDLLLGGYGEFNIYFSNETEPSATF